MHRIRHTMRAERGGHSVKVSDVLSLTSTQLGRHKCRQLNSTQTAYSCQLRWRDRHTHRRHILRWRDCHILRWLQCHEHIHITRLLSIENQGIAVCNRSINVQRLQVCHIYLKTRKPQTYANRVYPTPQSTNITLAGYTKRSRSHSNYAEGFTGIHHTIKSEGYPYAVIWTPFNLYAMLCYDYWRVVQVWIYPCGEVLLRRNIWRRL